MGYIFQSVREEEETAATEKVEIELEEERNRLTVEIENEQRVTLGTIIPLWSVIYLRSNYVQLHATRNCDRSYFLKIEVEHWLTDRHKFLSKLHEEWTVRLRDEVAAKEKELQALINARETDQ